MVIGYGILRRVASAPASPAARRCERFQEACAQTGARNHLGDAGDSGNARASGAGHASHKIFANDHPYRLLDYRLLGLECLLGWERLPTCGSFAQLEYRLLRL